jgi:hypothetical protein
VALLQVILTGAMELWPAFKDAERRWSIKNFAKRFGDTDVIVDTAGKKSVLPIRDYLGTFGDLAQEKLATGAVSVAAKPYLRTWFFSDQLPQLVDDFEIPAHFADDAFRRLPEDMVRRMSNMLETHSENVRTKSLFAAHVCPTGTAVPVAFFRSSRDRV